MGEAPDAFVPKLMSSSSHSARSRSAPTSSTQPYLTTRDGSCLPSTRKTGTMSNIHKADSCESKAPTVSPRPLKGGRRRKDEEDLLAYKYCATFLVVLLEIKRAGYKLGEEDTISFARIIAQAARSYEEGTEHPVRRLFYVCSVSRCGTRMPYVRASRTMENLADEFFFIAQRLWEKEVESRALNHQIQSNLRELQQKDIELSELYSVLDDEGGHRNSLMETVESLRMQLRDTGLAEVHDQDVEDKHVV